MFIENLHKSLSFESTGLSQFFPTGISFKLQLLSQPSEEKPKQSTCAEHAKGL